MLDFALDARRGSFHLRVECRFVSDWTVIFGPSGAARAHCCGCLPVWSDRTMDASLLTKSLTDTARGIHVRPATVILLLWRSSPRSSLT